MSLTDINASLVTAYQGAALNLPTAYEGKDFQPPSNAAWA